MSRTTFFSIVVATLLLAPRAGAQFREIEGLSLLEKRVTWVWEVLPVVARACLVQPGCDLDPQEKALAAKIVENLKFYRADSLRFLSEREAPDVFKTGEAEAHRVAVTGLTPQSLVTINTDRIGSLKMGDVVALLGHEVVHHTGAVDDAERLPDRVGAKFGRYFESNSAHQSLEEYGHPEIEAFYFGVTVPETNDYFKVFTGPVFARVALFDGEGVFDLSYFDSRDSVLCYQVPGSVFVNQQVTNPSVRVDRWFPGDSSVGVSFLVRARSVCRNKASSPDTDLQGVRLVGQMTLRFEVLDREAGDWTRSRLKLDRRLLRVLARAPAPEEQLPAVAMARVTDARSSVGKVAPGDKWQVEASLVYKDEELHPQCYAAIRGDSWHSVDLLGMVPPYVIQNCQVTNLGGGTYKVSLAAQIPPAAYPGSFKLDWFAFFKKSTGAMVAAQMAKSLALVIENSQPPKPMRILSAGFAGGVTELKGDQIYDYEVRIQNGNAIYDPMMSLELVGEGGVTTPAVGNMRGENSASIFRGAKYRMEGDILVAAYQIQPPAIYGGVKQTALRVLTLQFITENLGELFIDKRGQPDVYLIR